MADKSIPKSLRDLAARGERWRYNGFLLYDNERDRAIAAWLDNAIAKKIDVGEIIKEHLYGMAVGSDEPDDQSSIIKKIDKLSAQIAGLEGRLRSIKVTAADDPEPVDQDAEGQVWDQLGKMGV